MKHTRTLFTALLLIPMILLHAQSSQADADDGGYAIASRLEEFLGEPLFVPMQELWEKRGGWGGVLTAQDGTVVAFQSPGGGNCRRSRDGVKTWDADVEIAPDAKGGRALVDETRGDILYVNPAAGWLFRSRDSGATWTRESVQVRPDGFGNIPKTEGVTAMQCGITLAFGIQRPFIGRVPPARHPADRGSPRHRPPTGVGTVGRLSTSESAVARAWSTGPACPPAR